MVLRQTVPADHGLPQRHSMDTSLGPRLTRAPSTPAFEPLIDQESHVANGRRKASQSRALLASYGTCHPGGLRREQLSMARTPPVPQSRTTKTISMAAAIPTGVKSVIAETPLPILPQALPPQQLLLSRESSADLNRLLLSTWNRRSGRLDDDDYWPRVDTPLRIVYYILTHQHHCFARSYLVTWRTVLVWRTVKTACPSPCPSTLCT